MGARLTDDELLAEIGWLRRLARALTRDEAEADDLCQETLVAALAARSRPRGGIRAWLRGTLVKLSAARGRAETRRRRREQRIAANEASESAPAWFETAEVYEALLRELRKLPPPFGEALLLRYHDGLSIAEIAARQGIAPGTVCSRLQRGRARLKARLQAHPSRATWLMTLCKIPAVAEARHWLPWTMTKTTTKFAIGGACATSLSLALLLAPDPPRRLAQEETAREVVSAPLAGADFDALARRAWETTGGGVPVDREVPFATPPAPAQPADADATPRGTIVVVLLDGANGRQVGPGRLRARGAGRSVDHPFRASPVTLDLVAGSHRLLVHALGFEPLEVGPVDVPAGRTTPLGAYVMERGTAALTGAVRLDGAHLAAGRVELHGAGLHGCTACENGLRTRPCTLCGFAGDRAVRTLEAGRDFRFDGLCAGEYLVAAYDGEDALVGHVPVELARGAEERVEIELTRIDLPLRLVDEQGRPFRGTWTEDGVAYAGPVRVFASDRGLPCGRAVWTPPGVVPADAPAEAAPPTGAPDLATLSKRLLGAPRRTQETLLSAPIQVGAGGPLELSLPSPFPDLRTLPLQLVERAPALHVVLRLPAQSSRLDVACGPWMQSATLDLSRWNGEPITIRMDRRCPSPTPELVGARSCADCHRLPS